MTEALKFLTSEQIEKQFPPKPETFPGAPDYKPFVALISRNNERDIVHVVPGFGKNAERIPIKNKVAREE